MFRFNLSDSGNTSSSAPSTSIFSVDRDEPMHDVSETSKIYHFKRKLFLEEYLYNVY